MLDFLEALFKAADDLVSPSVSLFALLDDNQHPEGNNPDTTPNDSTADVVFDWFDDDDD